MKFYTNVQLIGNQFLVRGVENGRRYEHRDEFFPTLFVKSKKNTKYKTLNGEAVEAINPGTVRDCRDFYKRYEDVEGFEIYGNDRYIYQYISDKYPENEIKFDISQIKLVTLDIETTSEQGFPNVESCVEEILAITIQDYTTKQIITWGSKPFQNNRKDVTYHHCPSEYELLSSFINYWMQDVPDVITGWNIEFFDIPYICKRLERVLGEKLMKRFSPWGLVSEGEIVKMGRAHITFDIGGVTQLDYINLYKKFTYKAQESYRLDYIAQVELGQKKLDHSEFETFKDFYTNDWQKFIEYNIIDVELVDRLEDKMKLIELALTMAYDAKVNYNDVFYQVRMWDTIIYNYLKKRNIVIPPKNRSQKNEKYAGAYVKEPKPGKYDWVVSFDLNSLYPHLIMQYNISPETLRETRHPSSSVERILNEEVTDFNPEYATCANGAQYRKDVRGFLPELMDKMYGDRVVFKKRMLAAKQEYENNPSNTLTKEIARCNNIQMAKKIALNSAYGAIGNQYFRVYEGREKTNESIVGFLNKVCETEFEPFIEGSYQALADYVSAYDQKMQMKRENIAERGIWTAKKRYILNVWDSEGVRYEEPKLKMMGIEAVKSSTPAPCRTMIKNALKIMMNGTEDEVIDFIEKSRKEFKKLPPEDIAFPRSATNVEKYKASSTIYAKGTPIHIRGALLYNHYVKKHNLDNKYSLIQNGEKVKFCYLKKPNVIHENIISFIQDFPSEIGLDRYIDYDLQFDKAFLEPLKIILDAIGWNVEKTVNLELFFS